MIFLTINKVSKDLRQAEKEVSKILNSPKSRLYMGGFNMKNIETEDDVSFMHSMRISFVRYIREGVPILKLQAAEIPSPRESASMERDSESFYAKDSDSENRGLLKSALLKQRKSEIKIKPNSQIKKKEKKTWYSK